jgi:SAM-dependent methyltransferase
MAINALQVAWISRLADKKIIREGDSILEFGPQDLLCARAVVEQYGLRHKDPVTVKKVLDEAYDGEIPKPVVPSAFYSLFGTDRYRSLDLMDTRSDWLRDCNEPFKLPERFDVVTNFGTAEHVFNIAAMFQSVHDALKPGGVALHVLPAFGDVNHGFYNIHPTTYLDLSAANNYTIDEICYVDRWDIRNRILEENIAADFDFDSIPIQMKQLVDRFTLQRMVVDLYVANYNDPKTRQYGPAFPGYVYDYCIVALRKNDDRPFRFPVQGYYGGGIAPVSEPLPRVAYQFMRRVRALPTPIAIAKVGVRRFVVPLLPDFVRRPLIRSVLKTVLRDLALDVSDRDPGLSASDRWVPFIFKRQSYPAPPLDEAVMDKMMTVVESRIERLYNNSQLNVTIDDVDPAFLQKVKSLLTGDAAFVSFMSERYRQRGETTATRKKAIDDIIALASP